MARSTVRHTRNRVLESEDVLNIHEMTPNDDDDDDGGVALLLQNIRPPGVEVTSLASGRTGLANRVHVLGVHCFDHYRDDVDADLLMYRRHVVSPLCDWFYHEHQIRMTLRDADPHTHDSQVHNLGIYVGSLIDLRHMNWLQ